jgi:hypothetical protein
MHQVLSPVIQLMVVLIREGGWLTVVRIDNKKLDFGSKL